MPLGKRKLRIKLRFNENIEPQDVLMDKLAKRHEEEIGVSERKLEVPLFQKTIFTFYVSVLVLFSLLIGKVFSMQIINGEEFSRIANDNKSRTFLSQSARGVIYDYSGTQLVFNESSFDLVLDKRDLPSSETERKAVIGKASSIVGRDYNDIKTEIEKSREPKILVFKNLPYEDLLLLETKIGRQELPGFQIEKNIVRDYKDGNVFSHLIGYMGRISEEEYKTLKNYSISSYIGKMGLEKSYEDILRGNPGIVKVQKDVFENIKSEEVVASPENGKSLVLWLNSELQTKIRESLEAKLQELGAKKAVGIAMNPKTGGILALVSLPDFDNNLFQKSADAKIINDLFDDPDQPIFDRAISGRYLVGSTIKPFIASAALTERIIDPKKEIYSPGYIEIPHAYDPEIVYIFHDWTVHGWVDMRKAIAQSSNVYFYSIGGGYQNQKGLGPTKIKEYLELFGWTSKTGIDLFGEVAGFVPGIDWKKNVLQEPWWDGDTYNLSIGQGFLRITPLEVATAYSAIANGGKLLQPQVVAKIVDTSESPAKVLEEFSPKIIKENFIDKNDLRVVREGMRQSVSGYNSPLASSILLNSLPVAAAAKTGTAELGRDRFNNWITVFAPYDDPEIVLTLIIEDVKGVQAAVLPVAKEVLDWYYQKNL